MFEPFITFNVLPLLGSGVVQLFEEHDMVVILSSIKVDETTCVSFPEVYGPVNTLDQV